MLLTSVSVEDVIRREYERWLVPDDDDEEDDEDVPDGDDAPAAQAG